MSGTHRSSGAVLSTVHWEAHEERYWLAIQVTGLLAVYSSRYFLVISIVPMAKEMDWDERTRGLVLGAFYWGYILTQVIGGNLSDRFGGDLIQWTAASVWSLSTLAVVPATHVSVWLLVLVRFLTGLAQGMHYPALSSLVGHKVSENSRTKFYGIANIGSFLGIISVGFFGSLIIQWYNWKVLVFLVGCMSLGWTVCLQLFSSSHHKKMQYRLSDSVRPPTSRLKLHIQPSSLLASCRSVPWKELLSHSSVIACICGFVAECAYVHIIPSWGPTYFNEVFPNRTNSAWFYNSAPALVMAAGSYSGALLINHLIVLKHDITFVRKMAACICFLAPGVGLLIMSIIGRSDSNFPFAILVFLVSSYFYGYCTSGISVNTMDLTPSYSGSLHGVANTLGALPGVFAVPLIGYILDTTKSWAVVFIIPAAILFIGCAIFLVYGSARQIQLSTVPDK